MQPKYFDHVVPRESKERELIPLFEFVRQNNGIAVRKVSGDSTSSEERSYEDDVPTEKTETWSYFVNLSNVTDQTLWVEYEQDREWLQFELNPSEFIVLGTEGQNVHVRLCDCQSDVPSSVGGWMVTAVKAGYARKTYEFYKDRKRNVDLRGR